jgi:hypothetical protein
MRSQRARFAAAAACGALAAATVAAAGHAPAAEGQPSRQAAVAGPFATLLFSRSEITAADGCVVNDAGIARLDTVVAPYLKSLGMSGTGTLVTAKTKAAALTCTHSDSSMMTSWQNATALAGTYGWRFTSHTATYPSNIGSLTPAQAEAETCGSARTIDSHGLPGGHGMISYPGAQGPPVAVQRDYGARCFAWGRMYGSAGTTAAAAGTAPPYWQHTVAVNGGACNVSTAPCYTIASTGSPRYQLPAKFIGYLNAVGAGEWFTLQAYVLVTGKSPSYATSPIRWDCTAANVRLHWTNDNERYCYQDWQSIVRAIGARAGLTVTDPLTVGVAFGRPATYP